MSDLHPPSPGALNSFRGPPPSERFQRFEVFLITGLKVYRFEVQGSRRATPINQRGSNFDIRE